MPLFIISTSWTDQGIRNVKDAPKRSKAARALGKKLGVDIKQIYLTSGDSVLLVIVDAAMEADPRPACTAAAVELPAGLR